MAEAKQIRQRDWLARAGRMAAVVAVFAAATALGQNTAPAPGPGPNKPDAAPGEKKPDGPLGSYSLVTTVLEPSAKTHWLNPPLTIAVNGGTERAPGETVGTKTVPAQTAIEDFGTPRYICLPAAQAAGGTGTGPAGTGAGIAAGVGPRKHGCDALDRTDVTIADPTTIAYRIVSHGAAVQLEMNLEVRDILPVSHGGPSAEWRTGEVIFVRVPKSTPAGPVVSEVLVGDWHGEAIVFEVGKELPAPAKKALDDLGVHQDLGDSVLYSFRVREAEKGKQER